MATNLVHATITVPGAAVPGSYTYAARDGTAITGIDYECASGSFTLATSQSTAVIPFTVEDGATAGRTFRLDLSLNGSAVGSVAVVLSGTLPAKQNAGPTIELMLLRQWGYIQRATGAMATAAGIPSSYTSDSTGISAKNNQEPGAALGGYLPDGIGSSEGSALTMRALAQACLALQTSNPTVAAAMLAYAKQVFNAACAYLFKGSRPATNPSVPWYHHWLCNLADPNNGGAVFNVRGPLDANGGLVNGGYIGAAVTFTNGVGTLNPAPDLVYQVATNGSQFSWQNVYASIVEGTGSNLGVNYYIDKDGNQFFGDQGGGSFGQPTIAYNAAEPNALPAAGTIVLTNTTFSGTALVNYCVAVTGDPIAYGEPFEGWPMWRHLEAAEFCCAGDAIHWYSDAFRNFAVFEPTNTEWALALQRNNAVWQICCTNESNCNNIFKSGSTGFFNDFPLSYAYAYGLNADGTAWNFTGPFPTTGQTAGYSALRTSDGYVTFVLPLADGVGSDNALRYGLNFECQSLFLAYTAASVVTADIKVSAAATLTYTLVDKLGDTYTLAHLHSPSDGITTLAIDQFSSFPAGGTWTPDKDSFTFGTATVTAGTDATTGVPVAQVAMTAAYAGFGIDKTNCYPYATWTNPPSISYSTASIEILYSFKDSAGWLWQTTLPAQASLANMNFTFSQFTLTPGQTATGQPNAGKTAPTVPTAGDIQGVQFQTQADDSTMELAYVSTSAPTYASTGTIDLFSITYAGTAALTLKVGNVTAGSRVPIAYYGTLPFGLLLGGPSRSSVSSAPYRGPYISGYQDGTPYVDLADDTSLAQLLQFMSDAQTQFTSHSPTGITGPFMHAFLPVTWDSLQSGLLETDIANGGAWVWDAPDGNTAWPGWQYRAFDGMSRTWAACVAANSPNATLAGQISLLFLHWADGWLAANPTFQGMPELWGPPGWVQGVPLARTSYLVPHIDPDNAPDPHSMALTMKGAVWCIRAGADPVLCKRVFRRLLAAMQINQAEAVTDPMRGCFTVDSVDHQAYAFAQAEMLEMLALALRTPAILAP